jgi:hypothetical protein
MTTNEFSNMKNYQISIKFCTGGDFLRPSLHGSVKEIIIQTPYTPDANKVLEVNSEQSEIIFNKFFKALEGMETTFVGEFVLTFTMVDVDTDMQYALLMFYPGDGIGNPSDWDNFWDKFSYGNDSFLINNILDRINSSWS